MTVWPNARRDAACSARLLKSWPVSGASMPHSRMAPRPTAGWDELDWSILRQPALPAGVQVPEELDSLENGGTRPVGAERQCVEDLRRELAEVAVAVDEEVDNDDRRRVGTAPFRSLSLQFGRVAAILTFVDCRPGIW